MSGQTLDLVVLGFGLLSAVVGYRRGLVRQAANLVGLVAGLLVARRYAS
nr:colicin V production protein [Bacillota bacterium]